MKYSIIFLIEEESEEFSSFFDLVYGVFEKQNKDFEVLVVANGTERFVASELNSRRHNLERLKVIAFPRTVPQPVCLKVALSECSGTEILTLGPFQELSPASYEMVIRSMAEGVDLVVPYRKSRKDAFLNRVHSRILNNVVRWVLGVKLHDIGCSVKFYRREVLESVELYGNMYRYLPVLAVQKGFRIKEIECEQSVKTRKARFYKLRLYLDRSIEILNLFFSTNFSKKPLRFFNLLGAGLMVAGALALLFVGVQRVVFDVLIGARPLLILGMIGLVGGAQIAGFGLLGELISFVHGRSRKEYTIEKII
jgi:hypothetical protein